MSQPRRPRSPAFAAGLLLLAAGCATPATRPAAAPPSSTPPPAAAGLAKAQLPDHLVRPTAYRLHLTIDPAQETFEGEGEIDLAVERQTDRFYLHAASMQALSLWVEQAGRRMEARVERIPPEMAAADPGRILVRLPQTLSEGTAVIHAVWTAPFDAHLSGLYRATDGARWYAYTQFEVADARKAFPCFDEPRFKTPFEIRLTVPRAMVALSNAPAAAEEERGEGWKTVRFQPTRPLPTYLVAFYVGESDLLEGPKTSVPLRGVAAKGRGPLLEEGLRMHAEIIPILERYFGVPFPFPKLDAAALLEFAAGAMENAGLITFREEALLVDPATTPESRRRGVAAVIAHELAHQWFGDLVTLAWWNDLWLNESFASWMEYEVFEAWHPDWHPEEMRVEDRAHALRADALPTARPIRRSAQTIADVEQNFDGIVYTKGAAVLHMLQQWIGEDRFRAGLTRYLRTHAYGSATADDLFAALSAASGKDVRRVARPFIEEPGVPEIRAELTCEGTVPQLGVELRRYRPLGFDAPEDAPVPWSVPVCWLAARGDHRARGCVLVEADTRIPLEGLGGCPDWVHPNASEAGYYYWSLPGPQLLALARGVRDLASRAGLVQQAEAALASGRLAPGAYLSLLATVAQSEDPRDALRAVGALSRLRTIFPELRKSPVFRSWVRSIFEEKAKALGFDPKEGESQETRDLRRALLPLLARAAKVDWVLDGITERAQRWLRDPQSVSPEVAGAYLATAAAEGRLSFEALSKALSPDAPPSTRIAVLQAIGSLPPGKGMAEALDFLLGPEVRKQDIFYVAGPMWGDPERVPTFFEWVKGHWQALADKMPGFGGRAERRLPTLIGAFCDEKGRDEARAFFDGLKIEGSERAYAEGLARANHCIAVRRHGESDLDAWLSERAGEY